MRKKVMERRQGFGEGQGGDKEMNRRQGEEGAMGERETMRKKEGRMGRGKALKEGELKLWDIGGMDRACHCMGMKGWRGGGGI